MRGKPGGARFKVSYCLASGNFLSVVTYVKAHADIEESSPKQMNKKSFIRKIAMHCFFMKTYAVASMCLIFYGQSIVYHRSNNSKMDIKVQEYV